MGKDIRKYKAVFGGDIDALITLFIAALRSKLSCALPKTALWYCKDKQKN